MSDDGPWKDYQTAAGSSDTPPWVDYQAQSKISQSGGGIDKMAALEGFGQAATANYLPELQAAASKLIPNPTADLDAKLKSKGFNIQQPDDSYATERAQNVQRMQAEAQNSPVSYYGGQAAGALASAPLYGAALKGAGLAADIPAIASDATFAEKAGNLGSRVLQGAKQGAALGLVSNPNTRAEDSGINVGGRLTGGAISGLFGGALPIAGDAVSGAIGLVKQTPTKALSLAGGVSPSTINEYMKYSDRINASKSVEELKNISDDFVGSLSSDVENKQLSVQQSQDAFKALQSDLTDAYRTKGYDAREALSSANETLKDAHTAKIQNTAQDIVSTIQQLRDQVTKGSEESYNILERDNVSIPTAPIKGQVTSLINDLKIAGKSPIGGDATNAVNQLQAIRDTLDQFPKQLPGTEVKKMVKQLQASVSYGQNAAEFSQTGDTAIKDLSRSVNERLKNLSPEYREQMEGVAANTGLLSDVKPFADKATGAGLLSRIDQPTQINNKQALQSLGQKFNANYVGAANPENLPEYGLLRSAQNNLDNLRPDLVKQKISSALESSPELQQLNSSKQSLVKSQDALAPFKSIAPNAAGQTTVQAKLQQLAKGKNIEINSMFHELSKLTGTDFNQAMHDQNILAAFQKGAANGSRRTLMGSLAGFMIGGVAGIGPGGAVGYAIDQYGPTVTKGILDGIKKVSQRPTIQTIGSLDLPESVKHNLVLALKTYIETNPHKTAPAVSGYNKQR